MPLVLLFGIVAVLAMAAAIVASFADLDEQELAKGYLRENSDPEEYGYTFQGGWQ